MIIRLESRGPHNPVAETPVRAAGSVRRTSVITTSRLEGIRRPAVVSAVARDVVTTAAETSVAGTATLDAVIDPAGMVLRSLRTAPDVASLEALVGASVASGFRARIDAAAPGIADEHGLLYLLLDDLVGATLVGGYAFLRADLLPRNDRLRQDLKVDICAGWAEDATMIQSIKQTGQTPTPFGPPAPPLSDGSDEWAWPVVADPGEHGTRRVRRLDLGPERADGTHDLDVWFRDTHWSEEEGETVIHEYSLRGTVDPRVRALTAIAATPNVLPWEECPGAIGSAQRVVGQPFDQLRPWVRRELTGTTTCTHLNDTLRSLADLGVLLDQLR